MLGLIFFKEKSIGLFEVLQGFIFSKCCCSSMTSNSQIRKNPVSKKTSESSSLQFNMNSIPDRHFSWVDDLKRIMFNFYITTEPKPYNPNDYPRPKPRPRSPSSEGVHRRKRPRRDRKDIVYPKKAIRRKICQICYAVYADQRVKHRNEVLFEL